MTERFRDMMEKASKDEALKKSLEGVDSEEKALAVMQEHGYDITKDDLNMIREGSEISDLELDEAAGGDMCFCAVGGGGAGSD